jgi:putative ABC transport system permease protein
VLFPTLVERAGLNTIVIVAALVGGACTLVVGTIAGILQLPGEITSEVLAGRRRLWRRSTIQHELLIFQTTLAVLLITGSGMFAQSYLMMAGQSHASRLADVLVVSFDDGPGSRPDQDQLLANALDRVRKKSGVDAATLFSALPFQAIHRPPISVAGVGEPRLDGQLPNLIESTPELFDILQIEIVEGRGLAPHDDRGAPVVVVSETMARAVWPGGRAIGKCIRIGWGVSPGLPAPPASAPCREVVGIARDWRREHRPGAPRYMHYYVPIAQSLQLPPWMVPGALAEGLLIRKRAGIELPAEEIRAAVTGGRTDLPFVDIQPYAANEGPRLQHWVIGTQLLLLFGALALATAAMGMYAAFAHSVAERRLEIAVRLAVGASRQRVLVMMLLEGALIAVRGAITGVLVAALVGWAAQSIILGLSSPSLLVSAAAMAIVLTVAIVATWLPALTASRAEPNTLLRTD